MTTQVRISPDGGVLITFDAEDVVFDTPLDDEYIDVEDDDLEDVDLDDDDIEDDEPEE